MSKMFVVSIDDNEKAREFLASLQDNKVVAYQTPAGTFKKASVLFAYMIDASGLPATSND